MIMDRARQDPTFAMEIQIAAASRGYNDLVEWAKANPVQVMSLADGLLDVDGQDEDVLRVITKTHDVMRELDPRHADSDV